MRMLRLVVFAIVYLGLNSLPAAAQTFIYSGREYLQQGQSWGQIREVDLATNRRIQLTTSARHHWKPWCTPDNKFILFTTGAIDKTLCRFDRLTKRETAVMTLDQDIFAVSAALSD